MEEKDKAQKGEELIDVDEKGQPIKKKKKKNQLKVPKLLLMFFLFSLLASS